MKENTKFAIILIAIIAVGLGIFAFMKYYIYSHYDDTSNDTDDEVGDAFDAGYQLGYSVGYEIGYEDGKAGADKE